MTAPYGNHLGTVKRPLGAEYVTHREGGSDRARADDPPLSNRVISGQHPENILVKMSKNESSAILQAYPSMLVMKREKTDLEQYWYDLLARWGKSRNKNGPIKRGKIDHFSDQARFRMLRRLGQIGRHDPPFMLTLTYKSGTVNVEQAKKHLYALHKWMNRQWGESSYKLVDHVTSQGFHTVRRKYSYKGLWGGIWRWEMTTGRGKRAVKATPHFHLVIWNEAWHPLDDLVIRDARDRISDKWCKLTKDRSDDHFQYGCKLDPSHGSQAKCKNYLLGHHSKKTDQEGCNGGKHWGILNREQLQIGKYEEEVSLNPSQKRRFCRLATKLISSKTGRAPRDLSSTDYIHLCLDSWEIQRILKHIHD